MRKNQNAEIINNHKVEKKRVIKSICSWNKEKRLKKKEWERK